MKYTDEFALVDSLWTELNEYYSGIGRYYHTLNHLKELISCLNEVKEQIIDFDTLVFSIFYHDIHYTVSRSDNEEKSAELAKSRLNIIGFPQDKIAECVSQILATKSHAKCTSNDTNLMIDADLSVLGQDREIYIDYINKIRKEYSIYPDHIFTPGRITVLKHFLGMECIFKTQYFLDKYEFKARENIKNELEFLEKK